MEQVAIKITLGFLSVFLATSVMAQDRRSQAGRDDSVHFAWADVLRVDPQFEYVPANREDCREERIEHRERDNSAGGAVLGAIVGGALGNQVGKGDGRKAATIAGAVIGGAVGHNAGKGDDRGYITTEVHCRRVADGGYEQQRIIGYDVEYRYRGEVYMARLNYDPGDRLRVRVSVTPAE